MHRRNIAIFEWKIISYSRSLRLPRNMSRYWCTENVIGKRQALAYCKQYNIRYTLKPTISKFKFSDGVFSSLGTMQIRISTPNNSLFKIKVNVIPANVPLILGLDVLDNEKLVVNSVQKEFQATNCGWSMSLTHKHGHLFLTWNSKSILFTKSELSSCIVTSSILHPENYTKL